ncbi:MAG: efflux RND transporter periplasmic adaptor subunit, partial [Planctomycetes bacterium]|nr:efflux RND transporter periplasmic adaptor subunit [Planctomycetota bacterium]
MNSCGRKQAEEKEIIRPVFTMEVSEPSVRQRTFSGTAKSSIETPLAFRVGGKILEIPAKAGLRVEAGALIARLDPRDYDLQVQQSRAQLAQAEAQLKQSKAEYARVRRQYEANILSKSALDSQQAAYMSALASRNASQKGLEMALQQLQYCTLCAPLDGVIASVPVEAHQAVAAGQTVVTLTAGDKMEIQLGLPEALIGSVSVGVPAWVTFD